jgi:hypothetical protein
MLLEPQLIVELALMGACAGFLAACWASAAA